MDRKILRVPLRTLEGVEIHLEFSPHGIFLHSDPEPGAKGRNNRKAADLFFRQLLERMYKQGIAHEEVIRNRTRIEGVRFCNH